MLQERLCRYSDLVNAKSTGYLTMPTAILNNRLVLIAFSLATLITLPAQAQSLLFIPRVETGLSQYTLEFNDAPLPPIPPLTDGNSSIGTTTQLLVPFLRLGGTVVVENFYFDAYYHFTAEATDDVFIPALDLAGSFTGDRREVNLTAGYQVSAGISLFAGYRESDTSASGDMQLSYEFEHKGLVAGGAYAFFLSDSTSLSISLAYVDLDANLQQSFFGQFDVDDEGDGGGFKIGATSRTQISDDWAVTLAVDWLSYKYDMTNPLGTYDAEERDIQFRVGLARSF